MNKIKLKEILKVTRGMSLPGKYYSTTGKYIRLTLGNFDYPNMGFKLNTAKKDIYYTGEVKSEYILKKNDIITPLTEQVKGLLGETAFIPVNDLFVQSGDIALVRPIQNKSDANYLYYLISSKIIKNQLTTSSQQTKIRHTSPKYIMNCYAFVPHLNEQKKIGSLLRKVDELILLNKQINSELEQMAKTLYNYWFVQFDFPDENGRPYKSSGGKMVWNEELKKEIPEGWEVKYVKNILDVITGNEDVNFTSLNGQYPFFSCSKQTLKCNKYAFDGHAVLIAGNGDFNVKAYIGKFNAYQRTYILIPNDNIYFALLYQSALNIINKFKFGANGAIVKFIKKSDVEHIPLIIPKNKDLLQILNNNLYFQLKINRNIDEFTSLRDFLLPLLMNGQAVIKE